MGQSCIAHQMRMVSIGFHRVSPPVRDHRLRSKHSKPLYQQVEQLMTRTDIMLLQVQSTQELFKLWREGKAPLMMVAYSWMLGQVGDALGVQPGEEFRVALMEAQKVQFSGLHPRDWSHVYVGLAASAAGITCHIAMCMPSSACAHCSSPADLQLVDDQASGDISYQQTDMLSWSVIRLHDILASNKVTVRISGQVGAKVMLGDRPVRVTLARCWAALSRWARIRFICSLVWGGLFMGGEDLKAQVEQMKVCTGITLSFDEALYMLFCQMLQLPCLVNPFCQPAPLQCLHEACLLLPSRAVNWSCCLRY